MQTVINQRGARVFVPNEWRDIFPNLFEGKEYRPPKYQHNPSVSTSFWIERAGGGYGDVMHMLSALEDKVREIRQQYKNCPITISVPSHHLFLLKHLSSFVTLVASDSWTDQTSYIDTAIKGVTEYFDLCCPCADYEQACGFDVKKSRIEIFYETLNVKAKVRPPLLHLTFPPTSPFPKERKVIGIGLQSTDRWRNWSLPRFYAIAKWLQAKGYFVVTVDAKLSLEGIPAMARMPLPDVVRAMSYLDGFIGIDSGLTYISAALGATTLGLYGETNGFTLLEKHYLNGHAVQVIRPDKCQRPCYLNRNFYCNTISAGDCSTVCMSDITVELVQDTFERLERYGEIGSTRVFNGGVSRAVS